MIAGTQKGSDEPTPEVLCQLKLSSLSAEEDDSCSCEHNAAEYEEDGGLLTGGYGACAAGTAAGR